ncbi:MAG TPA: AMP-dependent synthetase, partial [Deltaproteobacteria bacterium]|nr:AMP-dependent synthetase [Deltaproteobacteria bacterium]
YPDRELGEVPAAVIQLREGGMIKEEDIIAHCHDLAITGYKIPKHIEFVESLPRHIDGKMHKKELEDRFWQGIEQRG